MSAFFKHAVVAISIATLGLVGVVCDADAARLGGKKSSGMQRSSQQINQTPAANPSATAQQRSPQQAANATPNATQTPSAARRWMGPLVGIASMLGIAALLSHFGLGEGMVSILTALLLAGLAFMVIKMVSNVFRAKKPQAVGGGYGYNDAPQARTSLSPFNTPAATPAASGFGSSMTPMVAANVNAEEFLRIAKGFFIRLQAANDKKDTDDLRRFLTPEMFAETQLQIAERVNVEQTTEILQLNAAVLSIVTEGAHDIGSVRFTGQSKCSDQVMSEDFSEIWHFTKWSNHTDQWSLAGIQQD